MNYLDILPLVVAWFVFVSVMYILSRKKLKDSVKIYYGLALIVKGKENVEKVLKALKRPLEKIPLKVIYMFTTLIFFVTMFFIIPVPLLLFPTLQNSKLVLFKYFLYSPIVIIVRNTFLVFSSLIHHISPSKIVSMGFMTLQPVIPGITVSLFTFLIIIITAGISILVHELAHGTVALRFNIPIVSGGFFTSLFIIMGGFVEPDEDKLNSSPLTARLAVYSAGVVSNILLALLTIIIYEIAKMITISTGYPLGLIVVKSNLSSIPPGSIILSINGEQVYNIYDVFPILAKSFLNCQYTHTLILKALVPGKGVSIVKLPVRSCAIYSIVRSATLNSINIENMLVVENTLFYQFLFWLFNLNITLALINALPAYPVDGGQFIYAIISEIIEDERGKKIMLYTLSAIFWSGLIITILYTFKLGLYVIG
ncbi:MAG: site-2 protease family protein [Crenarchaeota archaeon]|nr:site-2 protease family protein [Thermoproteota archaeon]